MATDNFAQLLLKWHITIDRPMPWKGERDAYRIWLSEIILQQTRVAQGLPYYERFVAAYPTIVDLAAAPEDEVLKLWEGLGYYSRARNLHATAKRVATEYNGIFPSEYRQIRDLKGVGDYTAAAIASFAFGLPHAVLDGNVYRVLSRVYGIDTPIDTTAGKKQFSALAQQLLDTSAPAQYNQAIMDLGATVCTPRSPRCDVCPMRSRCIAYSEGRIDELPFKSKKLKKRIRHFNYLVIKRQNVVYLRKRTDKDIWQGLYEYPLVESTASLDANQLHSNLQYQTLLGHTDVQLQATGKVYKQQLTHQTILAKFWEVSLSQPLDSDDLIAVTVENMQQYAFPKIIDLYLQDNTLYLRL